ncbi:MAG: argininosuccinate lyase [Candidatus Aminicenantes bacterium]|nr:argininosuccinate lyase [Candidatus Aminicenantes bacterium]
MKVWERRFKGRREDPRLEAFNASIREDAFLASAEIASSKAYAKALRRAKVLTAEELSKITSGLAKVIKRIEAGADLGSFEDIHSAVELMLIEEIGETGKKLHTGRSRNEQVVTDERLFLKREIPRLLESLRACQRAVIRLAEEYPDIIMPGYTHLQQAQYVLFSHYIMSIFWPLERAKSRLRDSFQRIDVLPLGTGALAGTTAPLDRKFLAEILGFAAISENSMDAVADRSFILETLSALSLLLLDLSRFAEDFVIFASREFGFLVLDEAIATSSSLMPQKKNPDFFELIRAGAGHLFGHFSRLFITVKGLPSTYNKDLQEDKVPLREGLEDTARILEVFRITLNKIRPNRKEIERKAEPFLVATDLADYLAGKGVPFREAHGVVGEIVGYAEKKRKALNALTLREFRAFHPLIGDDVRAIFDPARSIRLKKTSGSTHPDRVKDQIRKAKTLCLK